jgi:signal transduction histidine kinase
MQLAPSASRSPLAGLFVGAGVVALQSASDLVAGRDWQHVAARAAFLSVELIILMLVLSAVFGWTVRRKMSDARAILACIAAATLVGLAFGPLWGALSRNLPAMHMRFAASWSLLRFALFHAIYAQFYAGLWALAFVYPRAVENARVRAAEAERLRVETELARLRSHLEPHFLLNTLNAIAGLVTEEPREARRLLVCLGDLLRDAVRETSDRQRLRDQIAWLRRYAEILEARHRGAIRFAWEVAPESEERMLPRLLLQPLVENAVKHGALRRADGAGEVRVTARVREDGALVCAVADNGPGLSSGDDERSGAFGLHSVRRRLELEAPGASLRLESSALGTASIVEIASEATP